MKVSELTLQNFRNYTNSSVSTDADLVLILGDNAAGKTNFLEAVYFLSRLKSFRAPDELLIQQNKEYLNIQGSFQDQKAEAIIAKGPILKRGFKIDGIRVKRSVWKTFSTVLFVPNDLNLFILGPSDRRDFLNEILSQKYWDYAAALVSLDHILKQKSALLEKLQEGLADKSELEFWNLQLAEVSIGIHEKRRKLVDFFNLNINPRLQELAGFNSQISVRYTSQVENLSLKEIVEKLISLETAEIKSGKNLLGPHRDDFVLEKDTILNIYNSSRGELRTQILALKLMQAQYLSDDKQKPVILLDDVFSELDETRRTKLLESLSEHQIFITTTEEHHLPKFETKVLVLKVEDNEIK